MLPVSRDLLLDLKGTRLPVSIGGDGVVVQVGEPAADGGPSCICTGFGPVAGCPRHDGSGSAS